MSNIKDLLGSVLCLWVIVCVKLSPPPPTPSTQEEKDLGRTETTTAGNRGRASLTVLIYVILEKRTNFSLPAAFLFKYPSVKQKKILLKVTYLIVYIKTFYNDHEIVKH
jgi:hypothetical protein